MTGPDPAPEGARPAHAPAREPATATPETLSAVAQDYLKVVWSAGERSTAPVTTKMLADRLGVGAPTVSETVGRLCRQGLLVHRPYGPVELTAAGRAHAVAMVRRHRLLETFLVRELGYGWDEVHDEAEVLEHAVSDVFVERLSARLGHPDRDPHGDPIPTVDGQLPPATARLLEDADPGRWVVARISDADPALLRAFDAMGVGLDVPLEVLGRDADGSIRLRLAGGPVDVDASAARAVWLAPAGRRRPPG